MELRFDGPKLALMIGAPLAWAVLLWFHPSVAPDDVYGGLRDQVVTYQIVHAGTLVFIGLVGVALYALVRDLPGRAARISRLAIGPFLVMYAAWEAVIGLATGALVQHANEAPASARPELADAIQSLQENLIVGEMSAVAVAGALAWITATIAAAVAYRRVGAPLLVSILLGVSLIVVSHPPPIGPIGLACFAAAVALVARGARAAETVPRAAQPASGSPITPGLSGRAG